MANEKLQLTIETTTTGDASVEKLASSMNKVVEIANKTGDAAAGAAGRISSGFQSSVPHIAAASGAIREFEGNLPIRAVERFISTTLGLGSVLESAFPVVGAIALGGVLVETYRKFDLVTKAQEGLAAQTKSLDGEYLKLGSQLQRLNIEKFTADFGRLAGAKLAGFYTDGDLASDKARISYLADLVKRTQDQINGEGNVKGFFANPLRAANPFEFGRMIGEVGVPGLSTGLIGAQKLDIQKAQEESEYLNTKVTIAQAQKAEDLAAAERQARESITRHQEETLRSSSDIAFRSQYEPGAGKDLRGEIERATSITNDQGQIQKIRMTDEVRRNLETGFHNFALGLMRTASDEAVKNITKEYDLAVKYDASRAEKQRAYQDETSRLAQTTIAAAFDQQGTFLGTERDRQLRGAEFAGILPARTLRPRGVDADDFARQQDQRQASSSLAQISSRSSIEQDYILKSSIAEAETIKRNLDAGLIDVDFARKSGRITDADAADRVSALNESAGQQGGALNARYSSDLLRSQQQAIIDGTKTIQELQNTQIEKIQAILDRQQETITSFGRGAFDAVISQRRNPTAVRDFLRGQLTGTADTFLENALRAWVSPVVNSVIPKSASPLFKGTLFEKTPDILKAAGTGAPELRSAGLDLSAAARDLMAVARAMSTSGSGGGGGLGRFGAGGILGTGSSPIGDSDAGLSGSDSGDDLPLFNYGGLGTETGQASTYGINQGNNSFGFNAGTVAAIAGAGAGAYGAFQGFKKGGAGGALQGTSGALGATAAIASIIPGGQVVALAAGIASLATGIIGGLLNDPVKRSNAINQELASNQYQAPTALNVTQSSNGTFADFDARGNLRTSNFSAVPSVAEPYLWQQTHGFLGPPSTWYQVPGGQTSQFGAPKPVAPTTVVIQAMDSQSFNDFASRNHMAIGNAAAKAMQNGHGLMTSEVQRAANG